jgi:hypothetical protein
MGCSNGKNLPKDSPQDFSETGQPSETARKDVGEMGQNFAIMINEGSQAEPSVDQKPKKPPKPIERKKSNGNITTNGNKSNSSRYMQINHPRPTTQQRPHSSPVIPASKYVGHLSRPMTKSEETAPISDGRTPSSCDESDPELLTSIRASAAQKRAVVAAAAPKSVAR